MRREMEDYNMLELTDLSGYINMKISHIFHVCLDKKWHSENRTDNINRLYFVFDGEAYLTVNGERIDLLPNHIYLIPANLNYSYGCDDYMEKIFVHFSLCIIPNKELLSDMQRVFIFEADSDRMEQIRDMLYKENMQASMFLKSYIYKLLSDISTPIDERICQDVIIFKKYFRLYQYITDNLYADVTIEDICRETGFSRRYISYRFKQDTGQTLKEYFTALIVDRLKYMLQCTNMPVKTISAELRFNNEFYCSKFFKKHTGLSPREFRKKHASIES